jgi:hypothetical protein
LFLQEVEVIVCLNRSWSTAGRRHLFVIVDQSFLAIAFEVLHLCLDLNQCFIATSSTSSRPLQKNFICFVHDLH